MIKTIDRWLNKFTMYRVAMYGLVFIAFCAVVLGFLGKMPYTGWQLFVAAWLFPLFCFGINWVFAKFFNAPATIESSIITGLILFCLMAPAATFQQAAIIFLIALVAMASKYLFAWHRKHLFNPAAFAAVVFGFTQNYGAQWWVANPWMLLPVLVVGLLIARKTRRFHVVFACAVGFIISWFLFNGFGEPFDSAVSVLTSWPVVFFSTIMLTEPSTLPPKHNQRLAYGFVIGMFLAYPFQLVGQVFTTPEVILVAANIVSFFLGMKNKVKMKLEEKIQLTKDTVEFIFKPEMPLHYQAGQYLEWSLPHANQDLRGIRRYFTVSSAPSDSHVSVATRFSTPSSSFKQYLQNMKVGDELFAGNLSGDFVLPRNKSEKLVFIAGGVGITPFVSMIRQLMMAKQKTEIVLFYANKTNQIAYVDLLKQAEHEIGLKVVSIVDVGDPHSDFVSEKGYVNAEMIKKYAPDFASRHFYLSGPNMMVDNYKKLIKGMGIKTSRIKTDYFPGF
jgi:ferredoxin-NADP reductase